MKFYLFPALSFLSSFIFFLQIFHFFLIFALIGRFLAKAPEVGTQAADLSGSSG
jgi:hypothetical protein